MSKHIDAIVLARGGSKGIKNKNMRLVNGRPLLFWTLNLLLKSKKIKNIWVSSDSQAILNYSASLNCKTIIRPHGFSRDNSTSESSWMHAIKYIKTKFKSHPEFIFAPQVTSPLRDLSDIDNSIRYFSKHNLDSLFSANNLEDFCIWEHQKSNLKSISYNYKKRKRRQNIKKRILENGSFYIFNSNGLLKNKNRIFGNYDFFLMEKYKMFQIDSKEDLSLCEKLMKIHVK